MTAETKLGRRAALKTLGASAGAFALVPWLSDEGVLAFVRMQQSPAPPALKAMSAAQFRTIEALTEAIIPTDERSPGAKAARVPEYIDLLLSEQEDVARQQIFDGLKALDTFCEARFQKPFAALDEAQTEAALTELSRNEKKPETTEEKFFRAAKNATIHGYYTSEIGIHKELHYQGRKVLQEYVGCHTVDGKDCPHCGQKAVV